MNIYINKKEKLNSILLQVFGMAARSAVTTRSLYYCIFSRALLPVRQSLSSTGRTTISNSLIFFPINLFLSILSFLPMIFHFMDHVKTKQKIVFLNRGIRSIRMEKVKNFQVQVTFTARPPPPPSHRYRVNNVKCFF